jgi:hypothetical protein
VVSKEKVHSKNSIFWYHSIDEKRIWVHVKFDGGLSIPFARKLRYKKVGLFTREWFVLFSTGGI